MGWWQIMVWYPLERAVPSPAPLDPLLWFPIRSLVSDWLAATHVRAPLCPADSLPVVAVVQLPVEIIRLGRGRMASVVQQWGPFPASDLSTPVLFSAVGSVTGLGVRPLSWSELTALWDVLILISDC